MLRKQHLDELRATSREISRRIYDAGLHGAKDTDLTEIKEHLDEVNRMIRSGLRDWQKYKDTAQQPEESVKQAPPNMDDNIRAVASKLGMRIRQVTKNAIR